MSPPPKDPNDRIVSLIQQGYTYHTIGTRHKLKWWRVKDIAVRYESGAYKQRSVLYSRSDLCQQVFEGIYVDNVTEWIERRWLIAVRASIRRSIYRVTHDNLLKFLANESGWLAWEPAQLRDKHLRLWATELRAQSTWRWLRAKEAAKLSGVKRQTITQRIRDGWYKSAVLYTDIWFIRSDEFEQVQQKLEKQMAQRRANQAAMTIGNGLRNVRKDRKLSIQVVADRTGLSVSLLRDVERGACYPSYDSLTKLLTCYNAYAVIEADGAKVVAHDN